MGVGSGEGGVFELLDWGREMLTNEDGKGGLTEGAYWEIKTIHGGGNETVNQDLQTGCHVYQKTGVGGREHVGGRGEKQIGEKKKSDHQKKKKK